MWQSPDGKLQKLVLMKGVWGKKPSEESECLILIVDCPDTFLEYDNTTVTIGHSDNHVQRTLDLCLITMNEGEVAKVTTSDNESFTITLVKVKSRGWIYQWNVKRKMQIAQKHKESGVELFKQERGKDAAYRFARALKILHSIPIDVESLDESRVEFVPISEINRSKGVLYSNLASYYLKQKAWVLTIDVCNKALNFDPDNVKTHYKLGVACMHDKNYEQAEKEFDFVLKQEAGNKAVLEHMKYVKEEIKKADVRVNALIKKMFI